MNPSPPLSQRLSIYLASSTFAFCEVVFVLVPALVWWLVVYSTTTTGTIERLPVFAFAGLSLFSAALRDSVAAFHLDTPSDTRQKEFLVLFSLIGVVLATVLLTLASLYSLGQIPVLWSFYYSWVKYMVFAGAVLLFLTKSILIQRKKHAHYV